MVSTPKTTSLSVASSSAIIRRERQFIEATSRICSFHVVSRSGQAITPLEIRLVKDRLTLIERVLSTNESAYKHAEVILDLSNKLGYRGDLAAEVKVLGMLADSAVQAEDFAEGASLCERMVDSTENLQTTNLKPNADDQEEKIEEARRICWQMSYQLGRQPEFQDTSKRLALLSHALRLCPSEVMLDILTAWRKVEGEQLERMKADTLKPKSRKRRLGGEGALDSASLYGRLTSPTTTAAAAALVSNTTEDAAALAARTLQSVASKFPFSVRGRLQGGRSTRDDDAGSARSLSPDAMSARAGHVLARGVGWLIGANDED